MSKLYQNSYLAKRLFSDDRTNTLLTQTVLSLFRFYLALKINDHGITLVIILNYTQMRGLQKISKEKTLIIKMTTQHRSFVGFYFL